MRPRYQRSVDLLEDRAYADISVDDLAKGAGLSRPTFYFYFKSKEAVLLSLIEPLIAGADAEIDDAIQRLPADSRRAWRAGINAFFTAFASHPALRRAARDALTTSAEVRGIWAGFMQKCIDQTAAMITAERARGPAPETIPATDLAISLNQMNERTMMAVLAAETPAVDQDRLVDTLTHIWVSSIYGEGLTTQGLSPAHANICSCAARLPSCTRTWIRSMRPSNSVTTRACAGAR